MRRIGRLSGSGIGPTRVWLKRVVLSTSKVALALRNCFVVFHKQVYKQYIHLV
ncbi:hypothetical protein HanXRQr2_Chr07g0315471 [Helianthus annuus]|uniref:Uncharacterized protein n=1 Tax=Helianthus annuus TaxID=4232 RepID=A0A9K3INZ8_HELAN|nr:hypothetical protein HanXRQr2_Chr07g0315471 [Helianthus annuus]